MYGAIVKDLVLITVFSAILWVSYSMMSNAQAERIGMDEQMDRAGLTALIAQLEE